MIDKAIQGNRSGIPSSIELIYNHVEEHLHTFVCKESIRNVMNEKGLTNQLCIHLNTRGDDNMGLKLVLFHHENVENPENGNSRSTDFCAIMRKNEKPIIKFEAKRLSNDLANAREKEYVVGRYKGEIYKDSGGIERFKIELHGNDVAYGGMIGYVKTGVKTIPEWHENINSWINEQYQDSNHQELNWNQNDNLELIGHKMIPINDNPTWVYTYQSKSSRINLAPITFRHFWVVLN